MITFNRLRQYSSPALNKDVYHRPKKTQSKRQQAATIVHHYADTYHSLNAECILLIPCIIMNILSHINMKSCVVLISCKTARSVGSNNTLLCSVLCLILPAVIAHQLTHSRNTWTHNMSNPNTVAVLFHI